MEHLWQTVRASWSKPERAAYWFIAPSMIFLFVFTLVPLAATVGISLMRMDIFLSGAEFNGLGHYQRLFGDARFWNALVNTLYFAALEVPLQIGVSLLAALLVSQNTRFRKFARSALFLPSVCSLTAIGIMWSFLLDPQTGLYVHYLTELGLPRLGFLRDPNMAMPTLILITVWRSFGYTMVILIAAIHAIPETYYEAAQLDGAGRLRQFWSITVPLIVPALGFCVITALIAALQVFDQIFVTTQGGPLRRTESLVLYIYNTGFRSAPYDLGYSSAISVALFVLVLIAVLSLYRYFLRRETSDVR